MIPLVFAWSLQETEGSPIPGAQTERRGGAGPVRGLLGGKDLTGHLFDNRYPTLATGLRRRVRPRVEPYFFARFQVQQ